MLRKRRVRVCASVSHIAMQYMYLICISVATCSQEAGRYPAYKEMVAEYRWLNKCMYLLVVPPVCHYTGSGLDKQYECFLPQWPMVRNLPRRGPSQPPQHPPSRPGLPSAL